MDAVGGGGVQCDGGDRWGTAGDRGGGLAELWTGFVGRVGLADGVRIDAAGGRERHHREQPDGID